MNEDRNVNAETSEKDSQKLVTDELNPEEQEDVSGGDKHKDWIEIISNP